MLRSGHRINPSEETVAALAWFFTVKPDYFYDPVYRDAVDRDFEVLTVSFRRRVHEFRSALHLTPLK